MIGREWVRRWEGKLLGGRTLDPPSIQAAQHHHEKADRKHAGRTWRSDRGRAIDRITQLESRELYSISDGEGIPHSLCICQN